MHERVPKRRNGKLVDSTHYDPEVCNLCKQILKKKDRIEKMKAHIERWKREGNRTATIEKSERDIAGPILSILDLQNKHRKEELDNRRRRKTEAKKPPRRLLRMQGRNT